MLATPILVDSERLRAALASSLSTLVDSGVEVEVEGPKVLGLSGVRPLAVEIDVAGSGWSGSLRINVGEDGAERFVRGILGGGGEAPLESGVLRDGLGELANVVGGALVQSETLEQAQPTLSLPRVGYGLGKVGYVIEGFEVCFACETFGGPLLIDLVYCRH